MKLSKSKKKKNRPALFMLIILVIVGIGMYYYFQYQKSQQLLKDPTKASVAQTQALIDRIGKLIELPKEEPRVATVSDKTKLSGQSFFAKAENGDKVLIYTLAKKAILYRPSINKIIDVASINVDLGTPPAPLASVSASITPSISPTIMVSPTEALSPTP